MGALKKQVGESDTAYIERVRDYHRAWRDQNRAKVRAADQRYREAHPTLIQARRAADWIENRDTKIEKQKNWRDRNREKVRGYSRKYEASNPDRKKENKERLNADQRSRYAKNLDVERQRSREKSLARVSAGICRSCNKPPAFGGQVCEDHWFAARATQRLGLGVETLMRGQALKSILEAQGYKCAYTGRDLVCGVNASIEHKIPVAKRPDLKSDLKNIEWLDVTVNRMKTDMTRDEFIETCALIAERAGVVKRVNQ